MNKGEVIKEIPSQDVKLLCPLTHWWGQYRFHDGLATPPGACFSLPCTFRFLADFAEFRLCWHHFGCYHGKNYCDGRFATLTTFFKDQNMKTDGNIRCCADIVNTIKSYQLQTNIARVQRGQRPTVAFQQIIKVPEMPETSDILQFTGIRTLFSFSVDPRTRVISAATSTDTVPLVLLPARRTSTKRISTDLTMGFPDPLAPTSTEKQLLTQQSLVKSQKQSARFGNNAYIARSVITPLAQMPSILPSTGSSRAVATPAVTNSQKAETTKKRRASDQDLEDDDFTAIMPSAKRSSSSPQITESEPASTRYSMRSNPASLRTDVSKTMIATATQAAKKKKLTSDDQNVLNGMREVFRPNIRAAGAGSALQGSITEAAQLLLSAKDTESRARGLVLDYEDELDLMEVDDGTDWMEVDDVTDWMDVDFVDDDTN